MTYHVAAFSEQIAAAGTLQPIAAVPDDQLFTSGDDVRVPQGLAFLLAAFAIGPGVSRARIVAPSLRAFANLEIAPKLVSEVVPVEEILRQVTFTRDPLPLAVGESINFESDAGAAAGVGQVTGVIMLGDGPALPVLGAMRTVRATAVIAGGEGVWSSGALTFSEDLPAGVYQVMGGRCEMNSQGAFRLIFVAGGPRPGSLAAGSDTAGDVWGQRLGGWGIWGQFDTNQPPTLEVLALSASTTSQVLYLDIMRIA